MEVEEQCQLGHDVLTVLELGKAGQAVTNDEFGKMEVQNES